MKIKFIALLNLIAYEASALTLGWDLQPISSKRDFFDWDSQPTSSYQSFDQGKRHPSLAQALLPTKSSLQPTHTSGFSQGKSSNTHGDDDRSHIPLDPFLDRHDDEDEDPSVEHDPFVYYDEDDDTPSYPCLPYFHPGDDGDDDDDPVTPDPVPVIDENPCEDCEDSLKQTQEALEQANAKAGDLEAEKQELERQAEVINDAKEELE